MNRKLVMVIVILLVGISSLFAQTYTSLSDAETPSFMKSIGYRVERVDDGVFSFELSNISVALFLYDSSVQMYAVFTGYDIDLETINEWNKSKRYGRAYLDDDWDPVLEYDLDMEGGVSKNAIKVFIETFDLLVSSFYDYVEENG